MPRVSHISWWMSPGSDQLNSDIGVRCNEKDGRRSNSRVLFLHDICPSLSAKKPWKMFDQRCFQHSLGLQEVGEEGFAVAEWVQSCGRWPPLSTTVCFQLLEKIVPFS